MEKLFRVTIEVFLISLPPNRPKEIKKHLTQLHSNRSSGQIRPVLVRAISMGFCCFVIGKYDKL